MTHGSVYSSCPVCGSKPGSYSITVEVYSVIKCPNCGLEYTLPSPTDEDLNNFYGSYVNCRANPEIVQINAKRNLGLLGKYGLDESSSIMDFGAGNGEFVEIGGPNCFGVELSSRKKGVRIFDNLDDLPVPQFDFITLWGVLEHLNNIMFSMEKLKDRLRVGGYMVITTVDAESLIPYYYKPPEHLTYWTSKSLQILLEKNELEILEIGPYEMLQLSEVYLDRLLSRTPEKYREPVSSNCEGLPEIVTVPTNEVFVVAKRII
jgi:SAM-dependent methyltransferase